ncbi:MAG TPA: thiamine pyrophosphate-binding protein [Polyangiaceae bacterium]|nr:thiamine pyrophosphate-binding protein [Polyangiaceae bacterium]
MLVSDFIVRRLIREGVRHVFGVGGANVEDMFAAVQRHRPEIRAILGKHEHAAGTAADAYARLRGFAAVMVTSGGGAMNLVHAVAEARASEVPLLAIVGEPPRPLQGHGAFQDTSGKGGGVDALEVFRAAGRLATRVERASDVPLALSRAIDMARSAPEGPCVLLLAKDLQVEELPSTAAAELGNVVPATKTPSAVDIDGVKAWLENGPVVILAGPEVSRGRAQAELVTLARALDATVATTPDARDAFDNYDPRFLGVCGAMGHTAVSHALAAARLVVAAGTSLPLLSRMGHETVLRQSRLLSLGRSTPFVSGAETRHVAGDVRLVLRALGAELGGTAPAAEAHAERAPTVPEPDAPLTTAEVARAIERVAPEGSTIVVDAGNTGASAAHYLRCPRGGHWLLAMGMAGMGYTFGAAVGAALATGGRCFALAGDGAFYMNGLDIHTAIEHALPITYVLFDNRAHGMCLVRERILLGENAGYNAFRRARLGAGLGAMFAGLPARDCATLRELSVALAHSLEVAGPSVVAAELTEVEVPPFSAFRERAPTIRTVEREVSHAGARGA